MESIQYITMTDPADADAVVEMMKGLYAEDPSSAHPEVSRFPLSIRHLLAHPDRGRILLFKSADSLHGYAILIPFWSNEYGGNMLIVDELYVKPESRGRGLARGLFEFLKCERPFDPVAIILEVSPKNERARKLYESLGFAEARNSVLFYRLPPAVEVDGLTPMG